MKDTNVKLKIRLSSASRAAIGALLNGTTELGKSPSKEDLKAFFEAVIEAMAVPQLPAITYRDVNPERDSGGLKRQKALFKLVDQLQTRQGMSRAHALGHAAALMQLQNQGP